ncbi:MAG: hypothetical protein CMJ46_04190, partial [Planctomyces sp.]|nr:hypothetical protein [Planctomyces sp.]
MLTRTFSTIKPRRPLASLTHWLFAIAVLFTGLTNAEAARERGVEYDLDRYSIKIEVIFADQPYLTPRLRSVIVHKLTQLNDATYGKMWKRTVEENRTLMPRTDALLHRANPESFTGLYSEEELDKVFLCFVSRNGLNFEVSVREWDVVLRTFSLIESQQVLSIEEVPVAMNNLIVRVFRPMARVEKIDTMKGKAWITLRAGEYPAPDADAAQVVEGDIFITSLRYLDKNGVVQQIQFFDWNYLLVDEIDRGRLVCTVVSGVPTPVGSRGLRRVDQFATRVRPLRDSTDIRICKFNQTEIPLVAHYVTAFLKNTYREESEDEGTQYLSDRQGIVEIPLVKEHPVQWLYVNSGSALLGRVPVVPGIREFIELPLPDDSTRLEVEGQIEELKGRIVELIASRSSIMAEVRVAANKGEWEKVDELLPKLDELETAQELKNRLNTIRVLPMQE